jgi:spore coat polysaccharide biosynthesis protein SpsF (cytidylyltransferase family)
MFGCAVDSVIKLCLKSSVDIATNIERRPFPKGLSVEIIRLAALQRAQPMMVPGEEEHVTSVFYRRPNDFRIANLESGGDWGSVQLSVDTECDFDLAERMIIAANGDLKRFDMPALIASTGQSPTAHRENCLMFQDYGPSVGVPAST